MNDGLINRQKIDGKHESLLNIVKTRKLTWFGHVERNGSTMTNVIGNDGRRQVDRAKRVRGGVTNTLRKPDDR